MDDGAPDRTAAEIGEAFDLPMLDGLAREDTLLLRCPCRVTVEENSVSVDEDAPGKGE